LAWVSRWAWLARGAGAQEQRQPERQRVVAAARVAVGGQAEHGASADEGRGRRLDGEAVVAAQRADVDLEQGAGGAQRLEPFPPSAEHVGGTLGVGEHQAEAEAHEALGGRAERRVEAAERALEQQPARARGALGDQPQLARGHAQRVLVGQLAARVQAHAQAGGVDLRLQRAAAGGQLVELDAGEHARLDVRGTGHVVHAVGVEAPGVGQRGVERVGAVVEARQQVAVEVRVGHAYVVNRRDARGLQRAWRGGADVALDRRRRVRAQAGEGEAPAGQRTHGQRRRAPARAAQLVADRGDVAERQRAHAGHGRVVEQPQQPPVGDGEDGARTGPGRRRADEPDRLVGVERVEQLGPQRAAHRVGEAAVARWGRAVGLLLAGPQEVVGDVDLGHPPLGLLPTPAVGVPALGQLAVGGGQLARGGARGDPENGERVHRAIVGYEARVSLQTQPPGTAAAALALP
jgi:hypothetical protein